MRLYLVQHGEALHKDLDPERPLSEIGSNDVKSLAQYLAARGIRVFRVAHSGKRRAQQTAALLARAIAPDVTPMATEGLDPLDPPNVLAGTLPSWRGDTVLVGHQPFMSKMLSYLLCGDEESMTAAFLPGTAVCLEGDEEGRWDLVWMLRPELLREG